MKTIIVGCPHCLNAIEYESNRENEVADCPHCGNQITLISPKDLKPPALPPGRIRFKNPANEYVEEIDSEVWIYVLLLGCFYFAAKGVWTHAVAGGFMAFATCGLSWLVYPFFAQEILCKNYLRKGWVRV